MSRVTTTTPPAPYRPDTDRLDRLYDLLPAHIRIRDQETGQPLRALFRVLAETAAIVEDDIARLYENWFIETCDGWAVPYLAAVLGYEALPEPAPGLGAALDTERGRRRSALLTPRREAAQILAYRRRKGTLPVLEELARDVSDLPARAVELRERTAVFVHTNFLRPERGRTVDLRDATAIELGLGPFGSVTRTLDLRRPSANPRGGRGGLNDLALYVWPLRLRRVDKSPARRVHDPEHARLTCQHDQGWFHYTFSILGGQAPLFQRPLLPPDVTALATEDEPPAPIRPSAFRDLPERFYGPRASLHLWREGKGTAADKQPALVPVPVGEIRVVDLGVKSRVKPCEKSISIDPRLGRIALFCPQGKPPRLWVTYHHGAPADIGGGDYERPPVDPHDARVVIVRSIHDEDPDEDLVPTDAAPSTGRGGPDDPFGTIDEALAWWHPDPPTNKTYGEARPPDDRPHHLIIEIHDDSAYVITRTIRIASDESLVLRAGRRRRPLVGFLPAGAEAGHVRPGGAGTGGTLTLDGLLIADTPRDVIRRAGKSKGDKPPRGRGQLVIGGALAAVAIRDCTLVPGLRTRLDGSPARPDRPSLIIRGLVGHLTIDRSIVGPISVQPPRNVPGASWRDATPTQFVMRDSVIDNAGGPCPAVGSKDCAVAFVRLRMERSTVLGRVEIHAVDLAEDSLFRDPLLVARRRTGCIRFCHVPPTQTTPPRYRCQPDLALARAPAGTQPTDPAGRPIVDRMAPRFRAERYGHPEYLLLEDDTPDELRRGASDEAEMGVYHDEYNPQRRANLLARVAAFTPAGADTRVIDVRE